VKDSDKLICREYAKVIYFGRVQKQKAVKQFRIQEKASIHRFEEVADRKIY